MNKPKTNRRKWILGILSFLFILMIIDCIGVFNDSKDKKEIDNVQQEQTSWTFNNVSINKIGDCLFQTSQRLTPENALELRREILKDYKEVNLIMSPYEDSTLIYAHIGDTITTYISEKDEMNILSGLKKKFNFRKDDFSEPPMEWVEHKAVPNYADINYVYCYFSYADGISYNPRIVFRYSDDDWLFIEYCIINADGEIFKYRPSEFKRDNGSGVIWEWSDNLINSSDLRMINAIVNSKEVKIKYIGNQYSNVRKISKKEKTEIGQTMELYKRLGGKFE